jgi:hypothetical protein
MRLTEDPAGLPYKLARRRIGSESEALVHKSKISELLFP